MAHIRVPREAASPRHQSPLVRGLNGDDKIGTVGYHHVRDLVETFTGDLNPVYFEDLVVYCEESGALGQTSGDQSEKRNMVREQELRICDVFSICLCSRGIK